MAKVKNIEAFCPVCGTETKMELGGDFSKVLDSETKRWAKCKKCKQMISVDLEKDIVKDKSSSKEIVTENCSEYSPKQTYEIGQSLYHKFWDDYGRVIGKEITSNGMNSIVVEFQKNGQKKLIESII
jgi:hypothetical protein